MFLSRVLIVLSMFIVSLQGLASDIEANHATETRAVTLASSATTHNSVTLASSTAMNNRWQLPSVTWPEHWSNEAKVRVGFFFGFLCLTGVNVSIFIEMLQQMGALDDLAAELATIDNACEGICQANLQEFNRERKFASQSLIFSMIVQS